MATYKVLQDIEAEDKLIGPLTFKKSIFAGICFLSLYICYLFSKIPPSPLFGILPLPLALGTGLLAFYPSKDQPVEVILAAKIRFMLVPHKRLWDQSGIKNLVTITAPKKLQHYYSDGLSQTEVRSRLHALASTLDSRGWAVKNSTVNLATAPVTAIDDSERLVGASSLPQIVPEIKVDAADDILDVGNNPTAQHFDVLMKEAAEHHRQDAIKQMHDPSQPVSGHNQSDKPNDFWFMNQAPPAKDGLATFGAEVVAPGAQEKPVATDVSKETEQAILDQIEARKDYGDPAVNSHLKTIKPLSEQRDEEQQQNSSSENQQTSSGFTGSTPDILSLASKDNDDITVASLGSIAKHLQNEQGDSEEVVISLR